MLEKFEKIREFSPEFFAGANSAEGFFSCFDSLYDPEKDSFYILKGGPGTGKSTLMKRLSEKLYGKGEVPELFYCSSDPDSLDAVRFLKARSGIADGTAPHVMDPIYPGVCERVVALGDCFDCEKLGKSRKELTELYKACARLHKKASRFIRAAGSLADDSFSADCACVDFDKAAEFAERLCDKFLGKKIEGEGKQRKALLSGITPKGLVTFSKTPQKLCRRVVVIEDAFGGASSVIMSVIEARVRRLGLDAVICPCALNPSRKIDHVLIPEKDIAFCTAAPGIKIDTDNKIIHAKRFENTAELGRFSSRLRFNKRASAELLKSASAILAQAKAVHDQIEKRYVEAMDFTKQTAMGDSIFGDIKSRLK